MRSVSHSTACTLVGLGLISSSGVGANNPRGKACTSPAPVAPTGTGGPGLVLTLLYLKTAPAIPRRDREVPTAGAGGMCVAVRWCVRLGLGSRLVSACLVWFASFLVLGSPTSNPQEPHPFRRLTLTDWLRRREPMRASRDSEIPPRVMTTVTPFAESI